MNSSVLSTVDEVFDVLIIGGGITGAGIFRDLAMHGMKVLMIDKKDFGSQTSQKSSKMFHGGIRYMESGNFGLVWEALHEKNLWLRIAPHLCRELPFHMPSFKESKYPAWMLGIGLTMYDALSGFQNSNHRMANRQQTLEQVPFLRSEGLGGAGIYYDAIIDDSKVTLETIFDGLEESQSRALNYVELKSFEHADDYCNVVLGDTLTGETRKIRARDVVFATGPFTDQLMAKFPQIPWTAKMLPSKGTHIWIPHERLPLANPLVMQTKEGRLIFVIPQKEMVLVGTTEEVITGNFFDLTPSQKEIDYLIANLKSYFPQANIGHSDVISAYAGVRPLVKSSSSLAAGKTARNHKIFHPFDNVHVIVGGKLTTFRVMGQSITKGIVAKSGRKYLKNKTATALRHQSVFDSFSVIRQARKEDIEKILKTEYVRTFEDLLSRRMSIPTRKHWKVTEDFDSFFISLLPILKQYIAVTEDDIRRYP